MYFCYVDFGKCFCLSFSNIVRKVTFIRSYKASAYKFSVIVYLFEFIMKKMCMRTKIKCVVVTDSIIYCFILLNLVT